MPVHPICHRMIHARFRNADLAREYWEVKALRTDEEIGRFLRWIAKKPPDFHAPVRRPD